MTDLKKLMAEATPGPWVVDGPPWNRIVWDSGDNRVCFMAHSNGLNDARDIATSNLIALTPQLAAALIKAEEALASIAANTCCDGCQEAALVARAALSEIRALTGGNDD